MPYKYAELSHPLFSTETFLTMNRANFDPEADSDEYRRQKRKRLWWAGGAVLVIVVIIVTALSITLPNRNKKHGETSTTQPPENITTPNPSSNETTSQPPSSISTSQTPPSNSTSETPSSKSPPTQTPSSKAPSTLTPPPPPTAPPPLPETCLINDTQRFDCHPDRPISRETCENRGCCFKPASDLKVTDSSLITSRFLGVPSCYFPKDYKGYEFTDLTKTSVNGVLKRLIPSGFPADIQVATLEVEEIDDNRLRIQIKDFQKARFQPEVTVTYGIDPKRLNKTYTVSISAKGVLEVKRNSTGQPVFSTDLSRLIFSNQFLQLSTSLPSKYVYGLGEQLDSTLKSTNWSRYSMLNQGDLPQRNRNLYGTHPFYLVMEPGHLASGVFLLNSNAMDYVLQPTPALTVRPIGGIFDFFIFLGPKPADVVQQYTSLFGNPTFPPKWSLGFQLSKYGYFTLNKTEEVLNRNLAAGVPVEVQWHDIDYMSRHLDFTYDKENFTGLPEFVKKLHEDKRHYVAMISPGVSNTEEPGTYPAYDVGKELDLFIKDMDGNFTEGKVWNDNTTVFPDFSHDKTADYWKDLFAEFYAELPFDGLWLDMNEPLNFWNGTLSGVCPNTSLDYPPYVPGWPYPLSTLTLCMSTRHQKTEHYNEHNLIGFRESKATYAAVAEITKKRPFLISRASYSGQGVYSGHWSGDLRSSWDEMEYTIPAMLTFSLYGMPMTGSDICGFRQNTTVELCARWHSLGAFYPFSRNHNDYDTIEQDPAAMGPTVLNATKNALKLRYYLLPYLYTLFYRSHAYQETVARPLFFEFPDDENTYDIEDEFLWGSALLIMPALKENVTTITPYVPEGVWYDLKGKTYNGKNDRNITLDANLTTINLFIRGGFILPAQVPAETTAKSALNPFDILVALDANKTASGELFWDNGESLDTYKDKKYNLIEMVKTQGALTVTPKIIGYKTKMELRNIDVYGLDKSPGKVKINGKAAKSKFVDNQLLRVNATGYSILKNLVVEWE